MLDDKLEDAMLSVGSVIRKVLSCVDNEKFEQRLKSLSEKFQESIEVLRRDMDSKILERKKSEGASKKRLSEN
jgi:hypothetical protein